MKKIIQPEIVYQRHSVNNENKLINEIKLNAHTHTHTRTTKIIKFYYMTNFFRELNTTTQKLHDKKKAESVRRRRFYM